MSYPPVRQLGTAPQRDVEQRRMEARQARRISLAVRRCQELELRRQPAPGRRSRPIRAGRSGAMRAYAAAVAAIVLAVVIVYTVAASAGAS